jgi:hypothetical protein
MAAIPDASVGIGVESVYGTPVTVTRWYEFLSETLKFDKTVKQGQGMRVGSRYDRSPRRVVPLTAATGELELELASKGFGLLLQAAMGTGVSTLVSGSTQQQLFTPAVTAVLPKLTLQKGVVRTDGTVDPYTYTGVTVDGFEINCPNGDIVTMKFALDAKDMATATAYTAPSYPAAPVNLFHFAEGAITIGGAVVVPTTTVMASGGTAVANVRDFNLKVDNILKTDRFNFGASGKKAQPTLGKSVGTGSMTIEYSDSVIRDAYLADTPLALTLTFTTGTALSTGFEQFQVVIPEIKLNGDIPNPNGTDMITLTVPFDVLDNLVAAFPLYLAMRTADAAL